MLNKKVCILGASGVGKSCLIRRFMDVAFDPGYRATRGAQISKKQLDIDGETIQLMLWDIEGSEQLSDTLGRYLKGAAAMVYVVDGTRLQTLGSAISMREEIELRHGCAIPSILLFNKSDLADSWEISATMINDVESSGIFSLLTSGKEGSGVNIAFNLLSRVIMGKTTLVAA